MSFVIYGFIRYLPSYLTVNQTKSTLPDKLKPCKKKKLSVRPLQRFDKKHILPSGSSHFGDFNPLLQ